MTVSDHSDAETVPGEPSADRQPAPLPDALESPRTKLVYLYLRSAAGTGADPEELKRSLGMRTLALYPILETLVEEGVVERTDGEYVVVGRSEA